MVLPTWHNRIMPFFSQVIGLLLPLSADGETVNMVLAGCF
jgi:hypothetical protein